MTTCHRSIIKDFSRSGQGVPTKCDKVVGMQYCCLVQNRQKNGTSFSLGMYLHDHLVAHTVQLALTLWTTCYYGHPVIQPAATCKSTAKLNFRCMTLFQKSFCNEGSFGSCLLTMRSERCKEQSQEITLRMLLFGPETTCNKGSVR